MGDLDRYLARAADQLVGAGSAQVLTGAGFLVGWTLGNTGATDPCTALFYDGTSDAAPLVAITTVAAGESGGQTFPGLGLWLERGLYVTTEAGAQLVCYYRLPGPVVHRGED